MTRSNPFPCVPFMFVVLCLSGCASAAIHAAKDIARKSGESVSGSPAAKAVPVTLTVAGMERTMLLYAPPNLKPGAPLLLMFHGSDGTGASFRRETGEEFDHLADSNGFVVAYLDGVAGNWDDCRKAATYPARARHIDDDAFVDAVIAKEAAEIGTDPSKVFAVGISNGAQMAYRLAFEMADRITGVAAVAASVPTPENFDCRTEGKPISIMIVNGTKDPLNPYNGGEVSLFGMASRGNVLSTEASAQTFVMLNGLTAPPAIVTLPHVNADDPTRVTRTIWQETGKRQVVLYSIEGGGHVFPQPRIHYHGWLGRQTEDLDLPLAIWAFFSALIQHSQ